MRYQGLCTAFLLMVVLSACGTKNDSNPGITRWNSFPVAIYADSSITSSAANLADFHDAMAFWESKVGHQLFDYRGVWSGSPVVGNIDSPQAVNANVVFFQNPWNYGMNIAGRTLVFSQSNWITNALVMVNPQINLCSGNCFGMGGTSQRKVLAHELGHFIGLQHTNDSSNIMYPDAMPGADLSSVNVDTGTLQALVN